MPKYYCDYCKSYLTHDTMSVRKSHLVGKNHIRYYCNYYEKKAKETGIWNPHESVYEINVTHLNKNAPGKVVSRSKDITEPDNEDESVLPPPPSLNGFPQPPPSVLRCTEEYQKAISKHKKPVEEY
jgi:U1 small nuclear ribonucleoprotein C